MRLPFTHDGLHGEIVVEVVANLTPEQFGCDDANRGMPACTARISFPGDGYRAMFGWVQLVRSTDAATDEFEMDPMFLWPDADVPYCYYGHRPTLFDCPGRNHREDMTWTAHSFLAASPIEPGARDVAPLQGFSWGFTRGSGTVTVAEPRRLAPSDWAAHRAYLHTRYLDWRFAAGTNFGGLPGQ